MTLTADDPSNRHARRRPIPRAKLAPSVPSRRLVALGLLFYILTLVASLTGAPAFAVGGRFPEPEDVLA